MAACVVNGLIYVMGGRSGTSISQNEVYDPLTNSWITHTPMQQVRTSPAAGIINNKIYVTGGHSQGPPMVMLSSLEEFTPEITPIDFGSKLLELNKFSLSQNYPNPFNPTTTVGYVLQEKSNAKLTLLNAIGEEIAILVNEEQDNGYQKVEFDGSKFISTEYKLGILSIRKR